MIDLKKIKTYPIRERINKIRNDEFASICTKGGDFEDFYNSLPMVLAAKGLKGLVDSILAAKKKGKPVLFMMGAHVIKCGLNPIIIDLIQKRVITAIALNGAGIIHDFEIAFVGGTSEDVSESIEDGSFGMSYETGMLLNKAIKEGAKKNLGIGRSVGEMLAKGRFPYKEDSILYNGIKNRIPVTVHVAIGTDIIHQHPSCDGASIGKGSLKDFHNLVSTVANLGDGGVVLNIGSAVILPEVFLKALSVARNLKFRVKDFTTANLDMINHYRPRVNVLERPTASGGNRYSITGHHEIMLPLIARAIIEGL